MGMALLSRPDRRAPAKPLTDDATDAELIDHFVTRRDHNAFAVLVRRHGPMVFGVCRRVLRDPHDAEEAFQVTFLVLVRKAGSLRQPERLANWLYGVASRVAHKAKLSTSRRDAHERSAARSTFVAPVTVGPDGAELRAVIDEEMVALPEKYRAPLVLCYLEGLTNEDAARRLGWPTGSMSYRLARGRELLRRRLARRGLVCLALWPVFLQVLTERAYAGEVPEELVEATVSRAKEEPQPTTVSGRFPVLSVLLLVVLLLGFGAAAWAGWSAVHPTGNAPAPGLPSSASGEPAASCHGAP
ncbi:MAG TPA: sigma-70 family RNA polymerase sigma factor [Gemmataceae bacterium]|nr:sigma-70 family RNA polymerase sigma factor [Gemmataceae bacterium]